MTWTFLVLAGLLEIVGVSGIAKINQRPSIFSLIMLIGGFSGSFLFLSLSMNEISMGTAYAVWTGIGTAGSAIVGMLLQGESKDPLRLLFIALIILTVIGLKLVG
jgi:paired small multidrug resistance pump